MPKAGCFEASLLVGIVALVTALLLGCGPNSEEHESNGKRLLEKGDFRDAVKELSMSIEKNGGNSESYFLRAMAHLSLGESYKCFQDLDRVEAHSGETDRGSMARAWSLHLGTGDDEKARAILQGLKTLDGWKEFALSTVLPDESAVAVALRATQEVPEQAIFQMRLGVVYQKTKRFHEAESCFQKILKQNPHCAVVLSYIGFLCIERGQLDAARTYLNRSLKEDPLLLGARVNLDRLDELQHNDEKRLRLWTKIPPGLEENPLFFLRRGAVFFATGNFKKAQSDLTRFLALAKTWRFTKNEMLLAYRARAHSFYQDGKAPDALKDIEAAMAMAPGRDDLDAFYPYCLVANGRSQEAEAFIAKSLSRKDLTDEQRAQFLHTKASCLHTLGRADEAYASESEAIKLCPNDASYYSFRGYTLSTLKRFDEALVDFIKSKELGNDTLPINISIVECYLAVERIREGLATIDGLLKKYPDSPACHLKRGQLLLRLKRVPEGVAEIDIACASPNLSVGECETVGHLLGSVGQEMRAAEFFVRSCYLDRKNSRVKNRVNALSRVIGSGNMIAAAVSEAVSTGRSDPDKIFVKGLCRAAAHETQEALSDFDAAIKLAPRRGLFYTERGYCQIELGDLDEAFSDFNTAITSLSDHSPGAYRGRGLTLMHTGKQKEAIADFTVAINSEPTHVEAPYFERGMCYRTLGDAANATRDMESALKYQFYQRSQVAKRLAELYSQRGALDQAMNCYEIALKASATDVAALEGMANLLIKLGKNREAIDVYSRLIGHNSNATGYYYKRADLYRKIGESGLAEADLHNARNIDRYMLGPDKKKYK